VGAVDEGAKGVGSHAQSRAGFCGKFNAGRSSEKRAA